MRPPFNQLSETGMSSDNEETRKSRAIILEGQDNYREWHRYITNLLLVKDLADIAEGYTLFPPSSDLKAVEEFYKADRKAFGYNPFLRRSREPRSLDIYLLSPVHQLSPFLTRSHQRDILCSDGCSAR